jgi:hypothetical protein
MEGFLTFQDVLAVKAPAGSEIAQCLGGYLDCEEWTSVTFHVEAWLIQAQGTLYLESAVAEEGPWDVAQSWTGVATDVDDLVTLMTHYSAVTQLHRLVRWRFVAGASPASATFRMSYRVNNS